MTLYELVKCGCYLIVLILSLVQIVPIKINPWTAIARFFGRAINGGDVMQELKILRKECDEREAKNCRTRIIAFGDEIMRGRLHSQEHYKHVLIDCDYYESYCEKNPDFTNSVSVMTIELIKKKYEEHLNKNDFMK